MIQVLEINGIDYTTIAVGIMGALAFFAFQLVLCFKAKKMAVKLIPAYIILLFALFIISDFAGVFGNGGGVISARGILAMIFTVITGIAIVGEIAAWAVYAIRRRKVKQKV